MKKKGIVLFELASLVILMFGLLVYGVEAQKKKCEDEKAKLQVTDPLDREYPWEMGP